MEKQVSPKICNMYEICLYHMIKNMPEAIYDRKRSTKFVGFAIFAINYISEKTEMLNKHELVEQNSF